MAFEVAPGLKKIEIGLEGVEEILQNVAVILSTPKGSVPLDREFGVSWMFVDSPTPRALAELRAEILSALERYEPRVRVLEISFTADAGKPSKVIPKVKLEIVT